MTAGKPPDESTAESLLSIIRKKPGVAYAVEKLCKELRTDHAGILRAVALLADWDYRIKVRGISGVTFVAAPDQLNAIEISDGLRTKTFGRHIHAYRTVQSTNDIAAAQSEHGASEGTIVVADQQTKGRGRLGRSWFSPPGTGIYLSMVLRPSFPPEDAPGLSLVTALALAGALETLCPKAVAVKWPNDVLLRGRKVAGILTELSADKDKINHVIIGVGINVNHGVGHFPDELKATATSVRRYLKHKVNRVELLQDFLDRFEREYAQYKKNRLASGHRRLRRLSSLMGRQVTVMAAHHRTTGIATDIDTHGRLILQVGGRLLPISAGEVTVEK